MNQTPVDLWHTCIRQRSPAALDQLLADDVVFHSPVVHTPQRGKPLTTLYLTGALHVLVNDRFRYSKELVGDRSAVLEFETAIDDITINGVDIISWNEHGKVIEFKVMVRPLKAINLLHQRMAAMLDSLK
jgi:hypothetical protein